MKIARKIELLAPAKDLECGIEAINHGADAVYIGAPMFGARAAAGNPVEDIRSLCKYAHQFFSRVYVALNTILTDEEILQAEKMAWELYDAGVDALIIQDMGLLEMNLPPIPLHASTQTDNRSVEKVQFLEEAGFSQVVLARELSLREIKAIAAQTEVPLEVFVHGALCVSYSGQCYISRAITGRSANRGECAQFCRLPYTIQDVEGNTIASDKHLLSLKDLNLSDHLEELLDAGVTSLKIEGRLKDLSYVKNITAYYRQKLDELFLRRPEYTAASSGHCTIKFLPDPAKSFNRGFTNYFLKGRNKHIASFDTPKSLGEPIGNIRDLNRNNFTYSGQTVIHNGDGLCFINEKKELEGFRVNKVEGRNVFPPEMPRLLPGMTIYRNYDHEFEKQLAGKSADRKVFIDLLLKETDTGFYLTATDENGCSARASVEFAKEEAKKNQRENIINQLSKLGNTIFELREMKINFSHQWFIPSSLLSDLKRKVTDALLTERKAAFPKRQFRRSAGNPVYPQHRLTYLGNIANRKAEAFYSRHGVERIDKAFELYPQQGVPLMFAKHCILYSLGCCRRLSGDGQKPKEPLFLLTNQAKFRLEFDCDTCEMRVSDSC